MTNCKNCGAPIDIYADKCPWCDSPYEISLDEINLKRQKAYKDAIKTMQMYGSEWDFINDDYTDRAARYLRGERLELKWEIEDFDSDFDIVKELRTVERSRRIQALL